MFSQHPNSKISDSPVIQFSSQGSNPDLVTIRLNINDSDWDQKKYIRFTKFLEKAGVKLESARYVKSGSENVFPSIECKLSETPIFCGRSRKIMQMFLPKRLAVASKSLDHLNHIKL